jgi:hypothetical protein
MKLKPILLSAFLVCGMCACATSGPTRYHDSRAGVDVVVRPPPPRVVAVPAPRSGYVWAPGYWRWNGREHVWVEGQWMRERRGERWVPAHWEERGDHWRFEEGHWER